MITMMCNLRIHTKIHMRLRIREPPSAPSLIRSIPPKIGELVADSIAQALPWPGPAPALNKTSGWHRGGFGIKGVRRLFVLLFRESSLLRALGRL